MKFHCFQALLFLLIIPLMEATVRGRSSSSSSSSSKSVNDPRTSNDADAVLPPNCAAFCSKDIDGEWSSSIKPKQSSSSSSSADDSQRSCCRGGLSALKMVYHHGGDESGAELSTAIHALEEGTAPTALRIVEPCGRATAKSDSKDDAAPPPTAVFVDCARCFPDATAGSCAGTVNTTVNSEDWVCLRSLDGKFPTNLRIYYQPSSDNGTCTVFAADLHTSCSRPILPPFGMLLGDDAPCGENEDSPLVDLETTNYDYRDSSYLQFIDGVSTQRPGALLSTCAEEDSDDVQQNAQRDDNHRCCRGGVSFLKLQFFGGTFNVSGTLTLSSATKLACPSERRALGRHSAEKGSSKSSRGKSKSSLSSSKTKGSASSKKRSLSFSNFSARSKFNGSIGASSSSSSSSQSSGSSSSSKGSPGASTPSVAFIDCESECLSTASDNTDGMALRGRALSFCSTIGNQHAVKPGMTICLVSIDDDGVSLLSKMPTNLPLYLTPDDQFTNQCVQKVVVHTSCSKPIEPPFSQRFVDACKDEPSPAVIRPKQTADLYVDFIDGYSVDYARSSAAGFDYSFASCGCNCVNGLIPSMSPTFGMESSMAPSSETSVLPPPVVVRDEEPSGAPQAAPMLATSNSPSPKPSGASETLTKRPSTTQSTDSPAPHANKTNSDAPSVEKQEASSVPSPPDCESICENWVGKQCIIADSADRPVSEPCKIHKDWESFLERFLSNELSIENQIRRQSLVVAALATTQARLSAHAFSDP